MGWVEIRTAQDGKPRYIAKYRDLRGRKQSAGTFTSKREANKAWQKEEAKVAEGHLGEPAPRTADLQEVRRGKVGFLTTWSSPPRGRSTATTVDAHIMPEFGPMRMIDILPEHVREWITKMEAKGASTWTIQYCKYSILNSIFTTATLEDRVISLPPDPGGTDTHSSQHSRGRIITPQQFDSDLSGRSPTRRSGCW